MQGAIAAGFPGRCGCGAQVPRLAESRRRTRRRRGRARRQAGLFPNPDFQFGNENLRPGQTYTRDVDTLAYVTWPLDILGKRGQRVALAEQIVGRTEAELELTRRQVTQSVRLAYWTARARRNAEIFCNRP